MNDEIKQLIRAALATEMSAVNLSNLLFGPQGLFKELAHTAEERRKLVQTPLFREANARLTDLQFLEAEPLFKEVDRIRAACALQSGNGTLQPVADSEPSKNS